MGQHFLDALSRRMTRLPVTVVATLERLQHLLTSRTLTILVAHFYDRSGGRLFDKPSLDLNLEYLSRECNVMPLREALRRLEEGRPLPQRAVSLVVDDAAGPFFEMGWPSLRAAGVPFSLGVIPGMVLADTTDHLVARIMYGVTSIEAEDGRRAMLTRAQALLGNATWNDKRPLEQLFTAIRYVDRDGLANIATQLGVPDEAYMTWEQLTELRSRGVDLHSHSMSHPRFQQVTGSWLEWELSRSAELLEEQTSEPADTFVFPYGSSRSVTEPVRSALGRHGYRYSLVTRPGITTPVSDRYLLPRVNAEVSPEEFATSVRRRSWVFTGLRRTVTPEDPLSRAGSMMARRSLT